MTMASESTMESRSSVGPALALGALIAAGLSVMGFEIRQALVEARRADRLVTVKGLAEREVKADTAIWPLRFTAVSAELGTAYDKSDADKKKILAFLGAEGIEPSEIEVGQVNVSDTQAQEYGGQHTGPRYIIEQSITVHTKKVEKVAALSGRIADLVKAGVVLGRASNVSYHFTGVNEIKPEMLAQATKNARAAAAQFAADSGATVGRIFRASQGALSIAPLEGSPGGSEGGGYPGNAEERIVQKARVVMTVQFVIE
jgi:hypothetical protein